MVSTGFCFNEAVLKQQQKKQTKKTQPNNKPYKVEVYKKPYGSIDTRGGGGEI